jgi:hypothetical protein
MPVDGKKISVPMLFSLGVGEAMTIHDMAVTQLVRIDLSSNTGTHH